MGDIIDKANNDIQLWLDGKVQQAVQTLPANDETDCIDCGKPIGEARKRAVPWATRCIKCQTACETKGTTKGLKR